MSLLQKELDFSDLEATSDDLLRTWAPSGREIRSHRRSPRFTKTQLYAALAAFLTALSIGGGNPVDNMAPSTVLAAPAPPSDTPQASVEVTDRLEIVELRGGDRASRSRLRAQRTTAGRNAQDRARRAPRAPNWVSPVTPVKMTSCYGPRWGTTHEGIDYDGETGDSIRAVGAGVVVQAGWRYSGMGNSVVVDHGAWLTIYAHASRVLVKVGQRVVAGSLIARIGATGHVTGSHLHLAVASGGDLARVWDTLVNPASWLRARGVPVPGCG